MSSRNHRGNIWNAVCFAAWSDEDHCGDALYLSYSKQIKTKQTNIYHINSVIFVAKTWSILFLCTTVSLLSKKLFQHISECTQVRWHVWDGSCYELIMSWFCHPCWNIIVKLLHSDPSVVNGNASLFSFFTGCACFSVITVWWWSFWRTGAHTILNVH